jgi:hypothetical protein
VIEIQTAAAPSYLLPWQRGQQNIMFDDPFTVGDADKTNLNSSILVRRRTVAYRDLHLKGKRKQTKNREIGQDVKGDIERS